jgi:2-hydroxy-3-oxopropionate reductase
VKKVAVIGLGVMGAAIATNVQKAGFALTVHNRSREKGRPLEKQGAAWAATPAEAARRADVILLSLPEGRDVDDVLFGAEGVVTGLRPGTIVVDTSTIAAGEAIAFGKRLSQAGGTFLDCPVSGGPQGARNGTLTLMIGGPGSALEEVRPVLESIGKTITHVGDTGSGQLCKSCNQLLIVSTLMGVAEAVALCRKAGVDPMVMREALLGGSARSFVLESHAKRLVEGALTPGFRAALMRKDMGIALRTMEEFGVFAPAAGLAGQMFAALAALGHDDKDSAALGLLTAKLSGLGDA